MATTAREQIAEIATDVRWIRERQQEVADRLEHLIRERDEQVRTCEGRFSQIDKAVIVNKTKLGLLVAGGVIAIQAIISLATAVVKQTFFEGH